MAERYLIVGLGNPGVKYARTRHNIGFRCVDTLAERHGLSFDRKQGKALLASGTIAGRSVLLAKPQTYMNLSGEAVSAIAAFYRIPPERLLVIFDDLDLPVGTIRIRKRGGAGGQKGMKSIIDRLGTQEFPRIRFGIGRPPGRMDPADYVLLPFADGDESILVVETIDRVVQAVEIWLAEGIDAAMNRFNHNAGQAEGPRSPVARPSQEASPLPKSGQQPTLTDPEPPSPGRSQPANGQKS